MSRFLLIASMLTLGVARDSMAQAPTAEDVMAELRRSFEAAGGWQAHFSQVLDSEFSGSSSVLEGEITLSGDRYRIETPDQVVVTDGDTTWVYLAEDNQVIIDEQVDDDEAFTPTHFLDDRAERYDVAFTDEQTSDHYVVNLAASSPENYIESATLWIVKNNFTVTRIDVVDVNGASIRFEMSDVRLISSVADSIFTFVPTEGVEIIDLR